jgi:carbonic anhydrase/acetyltransferase-like protein (isoleucine patch superfamily)
MLIEHRGASPTIDSSAWIAPTAVVSGDVHIGPECRLLHGAVLSAEDGPIRLGARCVVMEHAVLRGRQGHPLVVGNQVLIGPHAHLNGATIGDDCFLATGSAVFPGAELGVGCEVRVHAVVHVNSVLPPGSLVPIGWIAVGTPATVYPPDRHDEIWAVQERLDFPGTVYGIDRDASASERMLKQSAWFGEHRNDSLLDPSIEE